MDGFIENNNCYKIHCFDNNDDVVDIYSSHHHEVSKKCSKIDYTTKDWVKFFESLVLIFEIESELFNLFASNSKNI